MFKSGTRESIPVKTAPIANNITKETSVSSFAIKKRYGSEGYKENINWLVQDLIPACANGIIVGRTGVGKTFVALDLLCSVATGKKFVGKETEHGLAVIVAAEGGHGISRRIRAWELQNSQTVGPNLIVIPQVVTASNLAQRDTLIAEIEGEIKRQGVPLRLLIVDTFSQSANGISENEAGSVSQYLQSCNFISQKFNATVINVHHTKRHSDEFRGSEAFISNVDFFLSLKRNKSNFKSAKLEILKQKEGNTDFACIFNLSTINIGVSDKYGKPVSTLCVSSSEHLEISDSDDTENSTISNTQMHAEWLYDHLSGCVDKTDSTLNIKKCMKAYFEFDENKCMNMPLSRAKKTLSQNSNLKSYKDGSEQMITLVEVGKYSIAV